jgi:hypothetical protein
MYFFRFNAIYHQVHSQEPIHNQAQGRNGAQKEFTPHLATILGLSQPRLISTCSVFDQCALAFLFVDISTNAHWLFYLLTFQLMHIGFLWWLFQSILTKLLS